MATNLLPAIMSTNNLNTLEKLQCIPLLNLGNMIAQFGEAYDAVIMVFLDNENELEKARQKEKQLLSQIDSCKCNQMQKASNELIAHDNDLKKNFVSTHKKIRTPDKYGNHIRKVLQIPAHKRDHLMKEAQDRNIKAEPLTPVLLDSTMATISDMIARRENLTPVSKEIQSSQSSVEFLSIEDEVINVNDETTEITKTPTGRTSPIIGSRKPKNKYGGSLFEVSNQQIIFEENWFNWDKKLRAVELVSGVMSEASDRLMKKPPVFNCLSRPDNTKSVSLCDVNIDLLLRYDAALTAGYVPLRVCSTICSPNAKNPSMSLKQRRHQKLKQSRLPYASIQNRKPKTILDVSTTTQFDGGRRTPLLGKHPQIESMKHSTEDEDIILPSPTSDHVKNEPLSGSSHKYSSPKKSLKRKSNSPGDSSDATLSITKLKYNGDDTTFMPGYSPSPMDINDSDPKTPTNAESPRKFLCPKREKRSPLSLNNNATNILSPTFKEPDSATEAGHSRDPVINSSLSLLKIKAPKVNNENTKVIGMSKKGSNKYLMKEPEVHQYIYKEDTVRKQVEKKQLPGWSCRECEEFYGETYKDNEGRLLEAMQHCSRHRGRFKPERPHTPPGFWDVRLSVPDDTQELNRRNNAV